MPIYEKNGKWEVSVCIKGSRKHRRVSSEAEAVATEMTLLAELKEELKDAKKCTSCEKWRPRSDYYAKKGGADGASRKCRHCAKEYKREWLLTPNGRSRRTHSHSKYRAGHPLATPAWAREDVILDLYALADAYRQAGISCEVDHIVPLGAPTVCGLHCEANLQLLPAAANQAKRDRWWPDMPQENFTPDAYTNGPLVREKSSAVRRQGEAVASTGPV